ncbi:MAG: ferritin family protein [Microgenomates group bacterium]
MSKFGNPFSSLAKDGKLTKQELIRAIRFNISAEYDAIKTYTQLAEAADSKFVSDVLMDIANEEKVHVGEFMKVLEHLDAGEKEYYEKGAKEVEEIFKDQNAS